MKQISIIILFILALKSFGQNDFKLVFRNNCDNAILELDYVIFDYKNIEKYKSENYHISLPDSGLYILEKIFLNEYYELQFKRWYELIEITKKSDTIDIPMIYLKTKRSNKDLDYIIVVDGTGDTNNLPEIDFLSNFMENSTIRYYFNCDKLCNGVEIDYYSNGNKKIVGEFKNGKPIELAKYRKDGSLYLKFLFKNESLLYNRIEFFDNSSQLIEYDVIKNKIKKEGIKRIVKRFNSNGTFLFKAESWYSFYR